MSKPFYVDIHPMHSGVTGSCFHMKAVFPDGKTSSLLIDCGMFQERKYADLADTPMPKALGKAEALLLTHSHCDHIGRVPMLVQNGFQGRIYCSIPTSRLVNTAWEDCLKIEMIEAKYRSRAKNKGKIKKEISYPRFQMKHIIVANRNLRPCAYGERVQILPNIYATFFMNGHIYGSAMILVEITPGFGEFQPINFLFSGDYNRKNPFFEVKELPQKVRNMPLHVVCEATYGANARSDFREPVFEENVQWQIAAGRSILIIAFALERGQTVMASLREMQERKKLSLNIPTYMDGLLLKKNTRIYMDAAKKEFFEHRHEFMPLNSRWVGADVDRDALFMDGVQKIIVTTSGMGTFGPAQTYIPLFVTSPTCAIHFTGYQCEGTVGRALQEASNVQGERTVKAYGRIMAVNAKVFHTSEFSSHASQNELLRFLDSFNNARSIALNHGDEQAKRDLAEKIISTRIAKEVHIFERGYLYRYDSYRLQKVVKSDLR